MTGRSARTGRADSGLDSRRIPGESLRPSPLHVPVLLSPRHRLGRSLGPVRHLSGPRRLAAAGPGPVPRRVALRRQDADRLGRRTWRVEGRGRLHRGRFADPDAEAERVPRDHGTPHQLHLPREVQAHRDGLREQRRADAQRTRPRHLRDGRLPVRHRRPDLVGQPLRRIAPQPGARLVRHGVHREEAETRRLERLRHPCRRTAHHHLDERRHRGRSFRARRLDHRQRPDRLPGARRRGTRGPVPRGHHRDAARHARAERCRRPARRAPCLAAHARGTAGHVQRAARVPGRARRRRAGRREVRRGAVRSRRSHVGDDRARIPARRQRGRRRGQGALRPRRTRPRAGLRHTHRCRSADGEDLRRRPGDAARRAPLQRRRLRAVRRRGALLLRFQRRREGRRLHQRADRFRHRGFAPLPPPVHPRAGRLVLVGARRVQLLQGPVLHRRDHRLQQDQARPVAAGWQPVRDHRLGSLQHLGTRARPPRRGLHPGGQRPGLAADALPRRRFVSALRRRRAAAVRTAVPEDRREGDGRHRPERPRPERRRRQLPRPVARRLLRQQSHHPEGPGDPRASR